MNASRAVPFGRECDRPVKFLAARHLRHPAWVSRRPGAPGSRGAYGDCIRTGPSGKPVPEESLSRLGAHSNPARPETKEASAHGASWPLKPQARADQSWRAMPPCLDEVLGADNGSVCPMPHSFVAADDSACVTKWRQHAGSYGGSPFASAPADQHTAMTETPRCALRDPGLAREAKRIGSGLTVRAPRWARPRL